MFFLTSKYYTLPEFGQMVQTKSDEEDVFMLHYRDLLNVTAIQDALTHEWNMSLPE